jgi:hypothetical protein
VKAALTFCALYPLLFEYSSAAQVGTVASIDGVVRRAESMDPVEGVKVTLVDSQAAARPAQFGGATSSTSAAGQAVATSDPSGRFALKNLRPGGYRLRAEKDGFVPFEIQATVRSGQDLKDLVLRLVPIGTITGRVRSREGPAARMRIEAVKVSYIYGYAALSVARKAESDDRGEYRIFGLEPGRYYVRASMPGSSDI